MEAVRNKAKDDIEKIKNQYSKKEWELTEREENVDHREKNVASKECNIDKEIKDEASNIVQEKIDNLESAANIEKKKLDATYITKNQNLQKKYSVMTAGYKCMVHFTLFYAIIMTAITALKTETIRTDFIGLINYIILAIKTVFTWAKSAGLYAAKLGDMIPNTTVALIVHWLLLVLVFLGILGGIGVVLVLACKRYVRFFRRKQADEISVYAGLVIIVVMLFMADMIKLVISINLFVVGIGVFIGFTVVRGIV